jgi:uncharacterized membrane protein YjjP (DUF1212 family)
MPLLARIIDTDALLESVGAALVAGVGVALAFSLAIHGTVRFVEARRGGGSATAGAAAVLTIVALSACGAAIVAGLVILIADRT